jgi:hypothetical protein
MEEMKVKLKEFQMEGMWAMLKAHSLENARDLDILKETILNDEKQVHRKKIVLFSIIL